MMVAVAFANKVSAAITKITGKARDNERLEASR